MNIIRLIFKNKSFHFCMLAITVQQILVGTGTYLMGDLAANVTTKGIVLSKVIILILSLVLSGSLFQYLMKLHLKKAEKSVLLNYFQRYEKENFGKSHLWRNVEAKKQRHDTMIREGQDSISSSVQFAADSLATVMNIFFNSVSVILVTSPALGITIFFAGFLGLWIIHLSDKRISKSASEEMESNNELNAFLAKSWDNIIIGNKSNAHRWSEKFKSLFEISENKSLKNVKINDSIVAAAGFLTSAIVVGTVFFLIYLNIQNTAKIIALLIMLPRSMQIVMHIQVIQSYWAHWKYLLQKLVATEQTYAKSSEDELHKYIRLDDISIHPKVAIDTILNLKNGRFTLTGKNGAGKSSLLLKLKGTVGDQGHYLPSHHQLELTKDTFTMSSGEIALCAISDIIFDSSRVVFLDEWDANLSSENRKLLDIEIEKLSKTKLVLEIRHGDAVGLHG